MGIRLNKVLTELDIDLQTAVDYLKNKTDLGEIRDDATTNTKISDQQYDALVEAFSTDKSLTIRANRIFPKKPKEKRTVSTDSQPAGTAETKTSADTYDVFISYSRRDYVKNDVVIPENPISAIMECFDKAHISYWVDREGIFSGQEFMEVITNAIAHSKMLVFVSSEQSNKSLYATGEIFEAIDEKKLIIPVKIDDTSYNPKFKLLIRPLDFIDYYRQPNTALSSLLRAVNKEKDRITQIEREAKEKEEQRARELQKARIVEEINEKIKDFHKLSRQQDFLFRELYAKSKIIGINSKQCPVCGVNMPIEAQYCTNCSWRFAPLYGVYNLDNSPLHDEKQLAIARQQWHEANLSNRNKEDAQPKPQEKSSGNVQVHIEVDADCELFTFSTFVQSLKAGDDNVIRLKPGKYKLEFVSAEFPDVKVSKVYALASDIECDVMEITLKEAVEARRKDNYLKNPELHRVQQNGKYGFADKKGNIVIPCKWNKANKFQEGFTAVKDANGKWGFIDRTGTLIIPCKWDKVIAFSEGLAAVKDANGKWGFIDIKGTLTIPCRWQIAWSFSEGLAVVGEGMRMFGFINKTGTLVIPCMWRKVNIFRGGSARVWDTNYNMFNIDKTGKIIEGSKQ